MTIEAKVIKDSIAKDCSRITSVQLRYPRFIHAELMTHRVFSRNSASSRAIPIEKLIDEAVNDPAYPTFFGKNQKGMQAWEEVDDKNKALKLWLFARDDAVINARILASAGLHKQIVNRVLEPFVHINVLVTATDFSNFFELRDHKDAQPEIQELAKEIKKALETSTPNMLEYDEWHLPYIGDVTNYASLDEAKKVSAARCASVSYKTVDGKEMTVEKALEIYSKLVGSHPFHASPFEHQARPRPDNNKTFCRNFTQWAQYRSFLEMT